MTIRPGIKGVLWMIPGAIIMLVLMIVVTHFQKKENPAEQLAFKARRVDLVSRMQFGLSSASEAEKSSVMAITDKDSKIFADQARAATAEVERARQEMEELLKKGGTQKERDLLVQFSEAFAEVQRVDNDLLALSVENTNLKAYTLAFGPAAQVIDEMNSALTRLMAANAESRETKEIMLLSFGAQNSALRIQTLLAPHIAEESNEKMDRLEASMTKEDEKVRAALNGLKAFTALIDNTDLAKAVSSYARFTNIRSKILSLSRENTNVRSLAISLNQKRKATLLCQDALSSLKQAILEEPLGNASYGPVAKPR